MLSQIIFFESVEFTSTNSRTFIKFTVIHILQQDGLRGYAIIFTTNTVH